MKRVFTVVGRSAASTSRAVTPAEPFRIWPISSPAASAPTMPISTARAPSEATFWATLPAPPSTLRRRSARSTGIGASGEMRRTSPST